MKDEFVSPGGYQTRSKAKRNKAGRGGGGNFPYSGGDENQDPNTTLQSPTREMSKHQQKKAKKQVRLVL